MLQTVAGAKGAGTGGWRRERNRPSLAEVFGSIRTQPKGPFWRKLAAFLGPGYLVAVGYMDPGNWATSLVRALSPTRFGFLPRSRSAPPISPRSSAPLSA
jgi:hypothetical protein